jgi:hypothetical protein
VKYWVYKDSRILGPFDKDAVAGFPGLDASTLVSAGDSAEAGEGAWRPVGEMEGLSALSFDRGFSDSSDDFLSTYGLLDKLQLDAAGLIGDDDFPGAAADLFQDADMKKTFGELLTPRPSAPEGELRRAKDQVSELTQQLEMLYQRVTELEAGQTNLVHRLVEKEIQLRGGEKPAAFPADPDALIKAIVAAVAHPAPPPPPAPVSAEAPPQAFEPAVPPAPASAPSVPESSSPLSSAPAADWPSVPSGGAFPSFGETGTAPTLLPLPVMPMPVMPAALAPVLAPVPEAPPAAPLAASFVAPPVAPPTTPPMIEAAAPASAPPATPSSLELVVPERVVESQPKKSFFVRKSFKVAPTIKAFRTVGADEAAYASSPAPEASAPTVAPVVEMPAAAPAADAPAEAAAPIAPAPTTAAPGPTVAAPAVAPFDWGAAPAPLTLAPAPASTPDAVAPVALEPMGAPSDPAFAFPPVTETPGFVSSAGPQTPMPAPPATMSFGSPQPQGMTEPLPSFGAHEPTDSLTAGNTAAQMAAPSTQEVLARLAKPAPAPATEAPKQKRGNKTFLILGGVLVVAMAVIGYFSLRHTKDLKQMAELDDGRSSVGYSAVDEGGGAKPPMVKPKPLAAPAAAPQAAPAANDAQAASQAKLDAAVAMVKEFPLDGERGTVASWLQYSYSASPGAGKESWSASETSDKTYLVEYRFTPAARGSPEIHYLFEADMERGFVIGKNLDGKSMLAGAPRAAEEKPQPKPKAKKKAARAPVKRAAKRPAEVAPPKEVPLLPLPNEGELRPPAEDDGAFRSDTVNSGL